ncbi:MAG: hypothetical protein ONB16_00775 [candidate division KSB1 bacterium]|nr:hypothetical protein [candidate division KSB1 bacterium]MDZ7317647.1 hypothetical protein [candidate division KSB1 bacterium]MDZ7341890.1 hypothetical protein [candidate division KSB1 bacterium]
MIKANRTLRHRFHLNLSARWASICFLLLGLLLWINCSDRQRLNPIDPLNPNTAGKPGSLRIYSELDQAVLEWQAIPIRDFIGYRIYRKGPADTHFQFIHLSPPESTRYRDQNLAFDSVYQYQISVQALDFETPRSDIVSIIPGPTYIWATDIYNRRLIQITHDGAHEIMQIPVDGYPAELALDAPLQRLWFIDILLNRVYFLEAGIPRLAASLAGGRPSDIAMDVDNDRIWISDETKGIVYVLNRQGQRVGEVAGFTKPIALDIDFRDGAGWVVDLKAARVSKIAPNLSIALQLMDFHRPMDISVNQKTGECWVADSSRVLKFDARGNVKLRLESGFSFVTKLAVDSNTGNCWVLDQEFWFQRARLLCFNEKGHQLVNVSGLSWPENIAVNPYDHGCVVADAGNARIIKFFSDGRVFGQITGYDYPQGLLVEYVR